MLKLKIVSPEKIVYDDIAESVLVPGTMGPFEILTNHAPIISSLQAGTIDYVTQNRHFTLEITGGFVEVIKNHVHLCVEC